MGVPPQIKAKETCAWFSVDPVGAEGWQTAQNMVNLDTEIVMYQ